MDKEKKNKPQIEGKEQAVQAQNNQPTQQPSNEEQMLRRQSAPRPTAQSEAQRMMQEKQAQMAQAQGGMAGGAMDGFKALAQVIGREQVQKANQTMMKYKEGKANLEKKIVENEQWYKLRHWECLRDKTQEIKRKRFNLPLRGSSTA